MQWLDCIRGASLGLQNVCLEAVLAKRVPRPNAHHRHGATPFVYIDLNRGSRR
jgi:hypothetical protein